jgi:hypothetical protein
MLLSKPTAAAAGQLLHVFAATFEFENFSFSTTEHIFGGMKSIVCSA